MNPQILPTPQRLTFLGGESRWRADNAFLPLESALHPLAASLGRFFQRAAALTGTTWRLLSEAERRAAHRDAHGFICGDRSLPPEGYRLCLGPNGISLFSRDWRGAFYGLQTLAQLLRQYPDSYPHLEIEDFPTLRERGYMLDCSRCRVPTIRTLEQLIEELAGLKYNRLQLYLEHTFAFPGHEIVWGDASPFGPEEIAYLDRFAAEHAIELVPTFNSFGHFERWLRHPEYFEFAECPYGWRRADGHGMPWGSTLAPTAGSLELLRSLFADYLPHFSSRTFNLGGDEPWELGMGRSLARVAKEGKHAVYLEFLNAVAALAGEHKERLQFWADIVLERPEVVGQLDPRFAALVWEYEANADLAGKVETFAKRGIPFQICPGTSTWNALGTRLDNARANIRAAGELAVSHGADGLMLTDWGDYGHHQSPALSLPPLLCGAQAAWNPTSAPGDDDLRVGLTRLLQRPLTVPAADGILRLGSLNEHFGFRPPNRSALVNCLTIGEGDLPEAARPLSTEEVRQVARILGEVQESFSPSDPKTSTDRDDEVLLMAHLLQHSCDRILASRGIADAPTRKALRSDLVRFIGRFEENWLRSSRIGGLAESTGYFRRALETYDSSPHARPSWPPTARNC